MKKSDKEVKKNAKNLEKRKKDKTKTFYTIATTTAMRALTIALAIICKPSR